MSHAVQKHGNWGMWRRVEREKKPLETYNIDLARLHGTETSDFTRYRDNDLTHGWVLLMSSIRIPGGDDQGSHDV